MPSVLMNNLGSIAVFISLAVIVVAIIMKILRDRRKGKCIGCDYSCEACHKRETKSRSAT